MNLKNYKTIKETEKALEVQFTYWEPTDDFKKRHSSKKIVIWVPKSCITQDTGISLEFLQNKLLESTKFKKALKNLSNFGEVAPVKKSVSYEWFSPEKRNKFLKRLARYISAKTYKKYDYHTIEQFYEESNKTEIFYEKSQKAGTVKSVKYTDGTKYVFGKLTLNNWNGIDRVA